MNQLDRDNERFIRSFVKCRIDGDDYSVTVHLARPGYAPTKYFNTVTLCAPTEARKLICLPSKAHRLFNPAADLSRICPDCAAIYQQIARARLGVHVGEKIEF